MHTMNILDREKYTGTKCNFNCNRIHQQFTFNYIVAIMEENVLLLCLLLGFATSEIKGSVVLNFS